MSRVLSYYRKDGNVIEYLSDHINDCISLLEDFKNSRIGRLGISLDSNFANEVRLSIVFHDLGKVFYQNNPTSFSGHEIFSAYILRKFEKELKSQGMVNFRMLKPAMLAVAFHHHPMGIRERLMKISKIKLSSNFLEFLQNELLAVKDDALYVEERFLLSSVLNEIKSKIEKGFLTVDDIRKEFQEEICRDLFNHIISTKDEDILIKKLSYLTLVSLVCVDYIAASRKRSGETRFGNVIEEFYKLYFNKII